jgi:hypothetical protein
MELTLYEVLLFGLLGASIPTALVGIIVGTKGHLSRLKQEREEREQEMFRLQAKMFRHYQPIRDAIIAMEAKLTYRGYAPYGWAAQQKIARYWKNLRTPPAMYLEAQQPTRTFRVERTNPGITQYPTSMDNIPHYSFPPRPTPAPRPDPGLSNPEQRDDIGKFGVAAMMFAFAVWAIVAIVVIVSRMAPP